MCEMSACSLHQGNSGDRSPIYTQVILGHKVQVILQSYYLQQDNLSKNQTSKALPPSATLITGISGSGDSSLWAGWPLKYFPVGTVGPCATVPRKGQCYTGDKLPSQCPGVAPHYNHPKLPRPHASLQSQSSPFWQCSYFFYICKMEIVLSRHQLSMELTTTHTCLFSFSSSVFQVVLRNLILIIIIISWQHVRGHHLYKTISPQHLMSTIVWLVFA